MDNFAVADALAAMSILADTREQDTARARLRLKQIGLPVQRVALPFGDYSAVCPALDLRDKVAIERKMHIDELAHCYCQDRPRFVREFERAKAAGAKLYLLIEDGNVDDIYAGRYRTKTSPNALSASLFAWLARYDCQLIFCAAQNSGRVIHDVLYREMKERLENMEGNGNADV